MNFSIKKPYSLFPLKSWIHASCKLDFDNYHILYLFSVLSAVSYYFGRIPFPLKQKHPLNYTIENLLFLSDGMKRLFFGNGKHKSTKNKISAISPNFNSIFRQFSETLISFGKTILFGKSPGFRQIVSDISLSPCSQPYPKAQKRGAHQPLR